MNHVVGQTMGSETVIYRTNLFQNSEKHFKLPFTVAIKLHLVCSGEDAMDSLHLSFLAILVFSAFVEPQSTNTFFTFFNPLDSSTSALDGTYGFGTINVNWSTDYIRYRIFLAQLVNDSEVDSGETLYCETLNTVHFMADQS